MRRIDVTRRAVLSVGCAAIASVFGGGRWLGAAEDPTVVDQAIIRGLRYLQNEQQPGGAWRIKSVEDCSSTSLAIMAFLAAGHVPGEGPYGERIERGIRWVLDRQQANGLFLHRAGHGPMYVHGISTLMLAEVAGMVKPDLRDRVRSGLEKGIKLILKAQAVSKGRDHAGGWRYNPDSADSDISVTGWQLLALRAAKNIGCDVSGSAIDSAVSYVRRCAAPGGGFAYHPGHGVTPTRSGTGILCLEICGEHHAQETLAAADYLLRRPLRQQDEWFYYGVYYGMIGMFQVGGRYWESTSDHLTSLLLQLQQADGRWPAIGQEAAFGEIYTTSMALLALCVEYQYLPIYQR